MLKEKIDAFVDVELETKKHLNSAFFQILEDNREKKQAGTALMVIRKYILRSKDQDEVAEWISGLEQMTETNGFNWN